MVGVFAFLFWATPAMSILPNPERPMDAKTCDEAKARLKEAEQGSPLVSKERNLELVAEARAQVERLCPKQE